jgi:hypothetical protein
MSSWTARDPPYITEFSRNDHENDLHFVEVLMTRWAVQRSSVWERAPLEALDFSQHIFGLGFHFKVCVCKVGIFIVSDTDFILNGTEHSQHPCQFMFGKQTGL